MSCPQRKSRDSSARCGTSDPHLNSPRTSLNLSFLRGTGNHEEGSQVASAHVDRRERILIAVIAGVGASAVLVCAAPVFAADPTPDPPPTETAHTPDPPPAPPEPQPSPPETAPAPSSSSPLSSSSSPSSTQASGSVASSTAKPDDRSAKRKHRKLAHHHRDLQDRSEALPAGSKWQRARNDALASALTLPAGASEAVVVQATVSPRASSAPLLAAALAAALATLLLAAIPSYALNASPILRPVQERRFELATIGVCILVGITVANGLPA